MTLSSTLGRAVALLDGCGVAHMIAGSVAGIQYSFARTTQDIDNVVQLDEESLRCLLLGAEDAGFYEWAKASESDRQLRDVSHILETSEGLIDWACVERWAQELCVTDLLAPLRTDQ